MQALTKEREGCRVQSSENQIKRQEEKEREKEKKGRVLVLVQDD